MLISYEKTNQIRNRNDRRFLDWMFKIITKTFTLVGGTVNEYFGTDDIPKRHEHLHELGVAKFLW